MNAQIYRDEKPPSVAIAALVARHGFMRIMLSVLAVSLRRDARKPVLSQSDLPERLRRDIGLPPEEVSPRYWDIRL
ncbi:MAG: hypothetical protein OEY05_06340 [Paracoccaceae bacterium]|jgi:hypothetical protein|nr:hypothetical protein [Paracoccaceae bacterium]